MRGSSAASAEISQRSLSRRAPPQLGGRQTHNSGNNKVDIEIMTCPGIQFVSRGEWEAKAPIDVEYLSAAVGLVFYHHTEGHECYSRENCSKTVQHWQDYHQKTKRWFDIAYQYLVGGDGAVYVGRGFGVVGAHTLAYNYKSVSFGFIGNFTYHAPTEEMLTTAENLIDCGIRLGKILANYTLHGQRDANNRDCPGEAFYKRMTEFSRFRGRLTPYID
uniref:Putative peptidoglycan recognition protein n=1 Tax=Ixodes ricinus TaxID=34613 RepID=A0A0K8R8L1_IXORI